MMSEKRAYLNLLGESFPGLKANIERCQALGFSWEESSKPFFKEERGEVLSHVGFLEYPMLIESQQRKVGALHAICTKNAYRGQGFASELIQEALDWAKDQYELVVLFTEIPKFYEKFSFQHIQEYRFHLACRCSKGTQLLTPLTVSKDNALFIHSFNERASLSKHVWVKDSGIITAFNTLFATYPTYWSLHYSPTIKCILSYEIENRTLHLFDVIASTIPSLDMILEHLPSEIEDIYFYFSPDCLTDAAIAEPYLYDNGYFMVHGNWPKVKPFMIPPLSRC